MLILHLIVITYFYPPPFFQKKNEPRGQLIVDLNAKYDGQSNEEDFKYSIIHGDANAFEINEENGQLTTLTSLDREIAQKHVVSDFLM